VTHPIVAELRKIRRAKEISQDAVGAALGKCSSQVSFYESGTNSPKLAMICSWADFLGYEIKLVRKDAP
jgi:transcriptional regulator with XRE-family HTH domain